MYPQVIKFPKLEQDLDPEKRADPARCKLFAISIRRMMRMCNPRFNHQYVEIEQLDIPDDCEVIGVDFDYQRQCFMFRIVHASFPFVANGAVIPMLQDEKWKVLVLKIDRSSDSPDTAEASE